MSWFKRKPKEGPAVMLREKMFALTAAEVGLRPAPEMPTVWGVLIDYPLPDAYYTLVTIGDGTTSLYFSNGGGIIGAGEHPEVREVSKLVIAECEVLLGEFGPSSEHNPPVPGQVRMWALTYDGVRGADTLQSELLAGGKPLAALFIRGQETITAIRLKTQSR